MADGILQKIGLEAVLITKQFVAGMRTYVNGLGVMESETKKKAGETAKVTEEMARRQEKALRDVGLAFSAIGAAGTALVSSMVLFAARTEELGVILEVVTENARRLAEQEGDLEKAAALTDEAVKAEAKSVKDLGITSQVASKLVAQLIRYNLDWTKATDLARLAQDGATFAAQNSSEALEGLTYGITTLNPRVLRTYGILINLEHEYRKWAEANDRTYESITQAEKQLIVFNAALAQGPTIAGAYEAAMTTVSKEIRTLQRDFQDIADEFGEFLLPILGAVVGALRDFLGWLKELPDYLQQGIVEATALGSAIFSIVGAISFAYPKVVSLTKALFALAAAENLSAIGLLGPLGLIAGLIGLATIGVVTIVRKQEQAQRDLHNEILAGTESYDQYIQRMHDAGLEAETLSENIWKVVQAKEAENRLLAAEEYTEASEKMEDMVQNLNKLISTGGRLEIIAEGLTEIAQNDILSELFAEDSRLLNKLIEDTAAFRGRAANAANEVVDAWRLVAVALQEGTDPEVIQKAIDVIQGYAEEIDDTTVEGIKLTTMLERLVGILEGRLNPDIEDAEKRLIGFKDKVIGLKGETVELIKVMEGADKVFAEFMALGVEYAQERRKIINDAAADSVEAELDAAKQREKAFDDFTKSQQQLEKDHQRKLADIRQEFGDVDEDLKKELIKAEENYQKTRLKLEQEYTKKLEEAERELAHRRSELAIETAQAREDAQRDYDIDIENERIDLTRDLEDIEEDHVRKLEEIKDRYREKELDDEADYYEELTELAEEYADKLANITDKYARERQEILDKYKIDTEGDDIDEQREMLQEKLQELQNLEIFGTRGISYLMDIREIEQQLEELKQQELDALEERKTEELTELEAWLAEEQAAQEAAYEGQLSAQEQAQQDAIDSENEAYELRKANRQEQYEENLEDLKRNLEQELEEIRINNERKEAELVRNYEYEKAEEARRYQERIQNLEIQLAEERRLIEEAAEIDRTRIQAQLAEERQNYAERQQDLQDHYATQKTEIETALGNELQEIQDGMLEQGLEILTNLAEQNKYFEAAHAQEIEGLRAHLEEKLALERWYQNELLLLWESQSPSKWMIRLGKSLIKGFETGIGTPNFGGELQEGFDQLQTDLDKMAFDANIEASIGGFGFDLSKSIKAPDFDIITDEYQKLQDEFDRAELIIKAKVEVDDREIRQIPGRVERALSGLGYPGGMREYRLPDATANNRSISNVTNAPQTTYQLNADFSYSNLLPQIRDQFRLLEFSGG